ncbi:TonB-dependent receptor [uncultured Cytophaga sp.]|uniref:TonB-dependent receptor n=1 Tax=uncultured Cytophaga sp. TaxID=160238 RepID=UPI0026247B11|nr:TonB-dependent receptor [uncultured Cytophaga sp.]
MYFLRTLLISTFCIASISSYSQSNTSIYGNVSSDNEGPLVGVIIELKNTQKGAQSDVDGNYSITDITPGSYILIFNSFGYSKDSIHIHLKQGENLLVNKKLSVDTTSQNEVVITAKTDVEELKESGFSVNSIDTKQYANTTTDLNQVLNRSAGVKVRESGGTGSDYNFSINGLSGKSIKYFVDGIPMDVMGGTMTLNNIPVNLAERIDVYKGVVPVSLGADAMGGAVNMITNQKIKRYWDASYSYGSFNTHKAALSGQYTFDKTGLVIRTNMFYNFSKNNYLMKGVEVWDASNQEYIKRDFKRFHDNYQSALGQLELGFTNKKWADLFFIIGSYSKTNQDIQTGVRQEIVYGGVTRNGYAYNTSMRWKKDSFLLKKLNANAFISKTFDTYVLNDTSSYRYAWDGSRTISGHAEQGGDKALTHITRPKIYGRINLSYALNDNNSFNVNYTFDRIKNQNYNELETDKDYNPGLIVKHILGIAYQQQLIHKKLTNTYFGKYYGLGTAMPSAINTNGTTSDVKDFISNYGYGIATRFKFTKDIGIKASFEHAYRLQEVGELFGNGYTTVANADLKPEKSNNINAGLYYGKKIGKHNFFIEGGAFYRNAQDFIYQVIYATYINVSKYENTSNVLVKGLEGEVRYNFSDLLNFSVNASYQNATNNTQYVLNSKALDATYTNKIPNQPWVFGNADLGIGKNNLIGKDSRLQLNWNIQYVHWYFLTWEAYGAKDAKNKIPSQMIHNTSLSYSYKKGKYNIALECRNITDALAYDNFRLQKPGRSFSIKLRYHFQ